MNKITVLAAGIFLGIACTVLCHDSVHGTSHVNPRDYQIELDMDTTEIWDGSRLVGKVHYEEHCSIDSVFIIDNQ